jgi:hypothetical protein
MSVLALFALPSEALLKNYLCEFCVVFPAIQMAADEAVSSEATREIFVAC